MRDFAAILTEQFELFARDYEVNGKVVKGVPMSTLMQHMRNQKFTRFNESYMEIHIKLLGWKFYNDPIPAKGLGRTRSSRNLVYRD
jgi:hypothetical protein